MELSFWVAFKVAFGLAIGYHLGKFVISLCNKIFVKILERLMELAKDEKGTPIKKKLEVTYGNSEVLDNNTTKCKIGFH